MARPAQTALYSKRTPGGVFTIADLINTGAFPSQEDAAKWLARFREFEVRRFGQLPRLERP